MLEEITLASPSYIERHGMPSHPEALDGHKIVGFHSTATGGLLPLEFIVDGAVRNIELPAAVSVNAADSYLCAARLGLGLIQIPRYHAEHDLAAGTLVQILADFPLTETPVSVLYPRNRQLSPRVRVFIDWLARVFFRYGQRQPFASPVVHS
jgi:DNA-binding transcriptional LysR family regulator